MGILAISSDNGQTFKKLGRYPTSLNRNKIDPFSTFAPFVINVEGWGWKMWYVSLVKWTKTKDLVHHYHIKYAESNDGIHWKQYENNPVLHDTGDTHSLFGWDPAHKSYVAYIRPGGPKDRTKYTRIIGRSESENFIDWTEPIPVLEPSASEPYIEYYAMPVFKYEHLYLGLLWVFHVNKEEPKPRRSGTIDIYLTVSKDGIKWDKVDNEKALPSPGLNGTRNPLTFPNGIAMVVAGLSGVKPGTKLIWITAEERTGPPVLKVQWTWGLSGSIWSERPLNSLFPRNSGHSAWDGLGRPVKKNRNMYDRDARIFIINRVLAGNSTLGH